MAVLTDDYTRFEGLPEAYIPTTFHILERFLSRAITEKLFSRPIDMLLLSRVHSENGKLTEKVKDPYFSELKDDSNEL